MTPSPPDGPVTVVSVTYNSTGVLGGMLASVPAGVPVVVVDNASADRAALAALVAGHPGALLVQNAANEGFGPACNRGAALADTEFLLFLNPDARLMPGAMAELVAGAARYPQASAMNPRLLRADGRLYHRRKSVLLPRRDWLPHGAPQADREVPVLSGAALFVRRAAFQAVGGFDPALFLYHEDDDLALRLRAGQGPLMHLHAAIVTHAGGQASAPSPAVEALKARAFGRSLVQATVKHRRPWARTRALLGALAGCAAPRAWAGAGRARAWGRLAGVIDGLRALR